MRDSVTVHMKSTPDAVWSLVSDVTRIGEFSPETFEAQWLGGATGPGVGARFKGHVNRNNKGVKYWTDCKVTDAVPGKAFAFDVVMGSRVVNSWRYEIEAAGDGVDVTESYALDQNPATRVYWLLLGWARGRTNREGMRTTLNRIKAVVEA
ncbi:MAG: Polyketide cyclase / dehydrase and lipid transport [Frankiales bacterium]|nr:Polyketide cyclase / dehydrase and lipid transport [Frankiales bacterium]